MITSQEIQDNKEIKLLLLEVAEAWTKIYAKQPDEKIKETIESLYKQAEETGRECNHDYKVLNDNTRKCMKCGDKKNH